MLNLMMMYFSQIKCYVQQLLSGLEHCHNNNVLHRDIKGSNLLLDNNGILKIADFGLATFFDPRHKRPMTSRVVTLWYRPPELLLGATDYGVGVDLWSAGCILAELLHGKPIMPGRTEVSHRTISDSSLYAIPLVILGTILVLSIQYRNLIWYQKSTCTIYIKKTPWWLLCIENVDFLY
jgi:serine/threonine protein kinase